MDSLYSGTRSYTATNPVKGRSTTLPAETGPPISEPHRRMLFEESGIAPAVAAERRYYTARHRSEVPEDFRDYQRKPGLVVPMYSPDGETVGYQLRPNRPRKGGPKYETPGEISPIVDVHPRMHEEVRSGTGPLLITEGAKTGDAATSQGIATVVLAGVWMWCVPKARPYRLKPCFDHIRLKGRPVFVAFDSDCTSKAEVQDALAALVAALENRGAVVKVIYLPDASDGAKQGVDDYLVAGGTIREMFILARAFDPADVSRIRLSRDERLRAAVEELKRRWWAEEWKGRGGYTDRDVALQLVEAAARCGKIHPDGLRVQVSWGKLEVGAKVSRRTLSKALVRLEDRGLLYRDNEGRKPDRTGAFVLRAKVYQEGRRATQEGEATQELQACDRGGLHLRGLPNVPRLRWSHPKYTPRRGLVSGTRRVRDSKPLSPRDRIERLGKIRGAVVDALEVAGGYLTMQDLCEVLQRKRARDVRRRVLPMLEASGIVEVGAGVVRLAADWSERLEAARRIGGELEADELAERSRKERSRAYHCRHDQKSTAHWTNTDADGAIEHLYPANRSADELPESVPEVSPLAAAIRDYLDRSPHDACQPAGWIGTTLWAYELYPDKPTLPETRAAIEELGGDSYLRGRLAAAKGAA